MVIGNKYNPNNIGLYRDDGLAVFKNTSGPQSEKIKKTFQKMFKNKALDIIINCNIKIVNYLDVTLSLKDGSYRPYKKLNDEINYIHVNSDHPPIHFKTTSSVNRKTVIIFIIIYINFRRSWAIYEQCLSNCRYKENLNYCNTNLQS